METLLLVVVVLFLVVVGLRWFARRFGGTKATAQTLLATYYAFESKGVPEDERLFQMLDTRMTWRSFPKAFLRELSRRLGSKEELVKFVILSERHGLPGSDLKAIASSISPGSEGVRFAVDQVAMTLTSLANHLGQNKIFEEAELALQLAVRVNPQWFPALSSLGLVYYAAGRYADAIHVIERFFVAKEEWDKRHHSCPN